MYCGEMESLGHSLAYKLRLHPFTLAGLINIPGHTKLGTSRFWTTYGLTDSCPSSLCTYDSRMTSVLVRYVQRRDTLVPIETVTRDSYWVGLQIGIPIGSHAPRLLGCDRSLDIIRSSKRR
jgi:hypothetical protein